MTTIKTFSEREKSKIIKIFSQQSNSQDVFLKSIEHMGIYELNCLKDQIKLMRVKANIDEIYALELALSYTMEKIDLLNMKSKKYFFNV